MYTVLVRCEGSSTWHILPGDEWPGTLMFDRRQDAAAIAEQSIGKGIVNEGEDIIVEAKAMALISLEEC